MKRSQWFVFTNTWLILIILTLYSKADINSVEIRVLPESIVYNEYYSLGDIAELDGFDVETIQKLAKIEIGKSPIPGRSLYISHGQIRKNVNAFESTRQINLILPSKAMISRASIKISEKQQHDLALKEIRNEFKDYDEVKITIKSKFNELYIPKGNVSYEMVRIGAKNQIGGYATWSLKLFVDGKEIKKLFVRAKAEVFDEVFVAKEKIARGDKITEDYLTSAKKNISKEKVGFVSESEFVVGKQAKRDIFKNEAVETTLVERPIIIKKGAPVKLIYKTKSLLLTNLVKALKEGKRGDVIPVRPLTGDRTIYATVIDENSVEVAL
ncbi:flagellar basal body P-ring formation chaperone FlgA [bacterium]|nr:flagellar basal body P-ring formation chaperone FlgA [bacterium]